MVKERDKGPEGPGVIAAELRQETKRECNDSCACTQRVGKGSGNRMRMRRGRAVISHKLHRLLSAVPVTDCGVQ